MGEDPPHHGKDHLGVLLEAGVEKVEVNALPEKVAPPHWDDEAFDVLSSALEEARGLLQDDQSLHQEPSDVLRLLEMNARLRKLTVVLLNGLGGADCHCASVAAAAAGVESGN
jgi:hypothetical protein